MNTGFGERLRELRRAAGVSQVELAGDQLSPSYISLLEAGKRQASSDVVQLLAERLHCAVGDLIDPVTHEEAQRAELEIAYAKLAMANGEYADARNRLDALLPSIASDRRLSDEVRLLLGLAHYRAGEYQEAIEVTLPLYERCLARASHLPLTTVGLRLTHFYMDAGDLQAAVRYGEAAVRAMAEQGLEDTDEYLRACATLIGAYYLIGDFAHASAWAAGLIEHAERLGSREGQAALYWNAALVQESQGHLGEALQLSERALALLSEQNASRDLGVLYTTCAYVLLQVDQGRVEEAIGLLDRGLPILKDFASSADLGAWEGVRAMAALAGGAAVEAEDFARRAVVTLAGEVRTELAQAHLSLGDALTLQDRRAEARDAYRQAEPALDSVPQSRATAPIWRELAERLVLAGQHEDAARAFRRALDAAAVRPCSVPSGLPLPGESPLGRTRVTPAPRPATAPAVHLQRPVTAGA